MNSSHRTHRRQRATAAQRAEWLAAFDRSGLSAAAFARQHGLHYTTFCNWRQRQAQAAASSGFVEIELPASTIPAALVIELGPCGRLQLSDAGQVPLAVRLLQELNAARPC